MKVNDFLTKTNLTRVAVAAGAGTAIVVVAVSATAIGTLAITAFAIRKLWAHRSHIPKLSVGELTIDRLIVKDSTRTQAS